jgi:hypothetical protein
MAIPQVVPEHEAAALVGGGGGGAAGAAGVAGVVGDMDDMDDMPPPQAVKTDSITLHSAADNDLPRILHPMVGYCARCIRIPSRCCHAWVLIGGRRVTRRGAGSDESSHNQHSTSDAWPSADLLVN